MEEREIELIDLLRTVWRQKWIIVVTFLVAVGSAWLLSEVPDPVYRASTSLLLMPPLASELDAEPGASFSASGMETLARSTSVLLNALEEGSLASSWTLNSLTRAVTTSAESLGASGMQSDNPVLLRMALTGTDTEDLVGLAQAWSDAFVKIYGTLFEDRTSRSYAFILENHVQAEQELAQLLSQRIGLLAEFPVESMDLEKADLRARLSLSRRELGSLVLEMDSIALYSENPDASLPDAVPGDPLITTALSPYTLSGALLLGFSLEEFQALAVARSDVLAAEIQALEAQLSALQQSIDHAHSELGDLDRQIALLTESVAFLSSRLQAARLAVAESLDPIRIIDAPMVSEQPISPKLTTNVAIAGFLGLMMGTLLAFFVDYVQRVKEREEPKKMDASETLEEPGNKQSNHETQDDGHRDGN